MNEELKAKLAQAYRILYMEGMAEDTTRGHISAKADDGTIYIKPWGIGFEEVSAGDLLGMDAEGNIKEGKGRPHSELIMHLEIYRQRQDVRSITHVHPPYSVLFSSLYRGRLYRIGQHSLHFGGVLPFHESGELIHTREQAARLVELLAGGPAVMMRNHGVITTGSSIEESVIMAIDFEKAAWEHLTAAASGEPEEMDQETAKRMYAKICTATQYTMLWAYYCRKVDRERF
jgi:L-ribulose-5-phosphate 4-epimerase